MMDPVLEQSEIGARTLHVPVLEALERLDNSELGKEAKKENPETAAQILSTRSAAAESATTLVLAPAAPPRTSGVVVLKLSPEAHDAKMAELIDVLQKEGVTKALAAAEGVGSPHLLDDFHRVLTEYMREGLPAAHAPRKKSALAKALGLSLLEITLPRGTANADKSSQPDPVKAAHDFIALMESFYRSTIALGAENYFSFEIANPIGVPQTSVYIAVPYGRRELFEKQLLGIYPAARITERPDDYNIFVAGGALAGSVAELSNRPIFSLRTFQELPNDGLDVLLNTFSQLSVTDEGAAVQFVIMPGDRGLELRYRNALEEIRKGAPIRRATNIKRGISRLAWEVYTVFSSQKDIDPDKRPGGEDPRIKAIERKVASPLMFACIRVLASAQTQDRAAAIVSDLQAPFQQLADSAAGSGIAFAQVKKRKLAGLARAFSYRLFDENSASILSSAEIATLAHLPRPEVSSAAPEVHQEHSAISAAPVNMPTDGTLLGINNFRSMQTKIFLSPVDRLRHLYAIGQTGTGKTTFLKDIILQDIRNGEGACFIDPHGSDVLDILGSIPPERIDDVIYFDPGNTARPLGLNMLEFDPAHPEQKTLVVDELLGTFKKLFGAVPESMGPAFEQYFRNAALLVMESPELGNTLLDIGRIFSDDSFRAKKLAVCKNPVVVQFWHGIAERAGGEQSLENFGPYITSKFDVFTTNEIMRPIIAQQYSSINFREVMDQKKILLVNLAKGRIGEINGNLLGLIIVGKFLLAALSRVDSFGKDLPPFYLTIDEFHNFSTPSIATILSEARKYKLSLTIAHQFIAQLTEEIRDAVFGNVGSMVAFRVGAQDAEFLEKQFAPVFTAADLLRIDNYNAFARILARGAPVPPFSISIPPFPAGNHENALRLAELSSLIYGRPREEVEAYIAGRYGQ